MSWILMTIIVFLILNNIRNYKHLERLERADDAIMASFVAVIMDNKIDSKTAADKYLEYLDVTLPAKDYKEFMQRLCERDGIELSIVGGRVSEATRMKLAQNLAVDFEATYARVQDYNNLIIT